MTLAALLVALSTAGPVTVPPETLGTRAVRPDGMEVLVVPVEGARSASLRVVVRAGSADDPPGKEGLAHLVEHLLLGAEGPDGLDLPEAARAAGAHLNAFTYRDATTYVLDAPAEVFPALAERLLRAVSDPALHRVDLSKELDVVAREHEYHGEEAGVRRLVEDTLFRTNAPEGPILGIASSRDRIRRDDLVRFYQRHYLTSATSVVAAGAVSAADLDALLERAVRLPPALDGERVVRPIASPVLPANERIRAPFLVVVLGYAIDEADREACAPLAALLERRLVLDLVAGQAGAPALQTVEASCVDLRGLPFVLAKGYTRTLDAPDLAHSIQRVFDEAARRPATAAERTALELRLARLREIAMTNPAALADEVARAAQRAPTAGGTPLPARHPRAFPAEAVRRVAGRAFAEERRLLVLISPFEG